mgnify:CR=1 FL=1
MRKMHYRRKGFTFLEIMFVVVIIGLLVAIVAPNLTGKSRKARVMTTKASMNSVETALQNFEMNVGRFPTTDEGLDALLKCPGDVNEEMWDSPYLKRTPKDAWGNEFAYKCPGEHNADFDLYSKGPDGQEDTEDDIVNWETEEDEF